MWNKFAEIFQDSSYKRLGIAVCFSAVLHALLFGGFDFRLPYMKKEMHLIEARIQMPKSLIKQEVAPIKEELISPKPFPSEPPKLVENSELEEDAQPVSSGEVVASSETISQTPPVESAIAQPDTTKPESQQIEQPVDIGLVINENAYQYVETDFDVYTNIDGVAQGKASIIFNLKEDNRYELKWLTQGTGLASLFFPDLLQTSEGLLTKTGLQPVKYVYLFGSKEDKTRTANFDWQARTVIMESSKGIKTEELTEGSQDLLSFMYQFMYVAPLQHMQISIATGKKLTTYDYSFEGEENVNSSLGEIKSIHIVHNGADLDEKTEIWLAVDYQYLPVKIRKIEKNGSMVELIATRVNTSRPTVDHNLLKDKQ